MKTGSINYDFLPELTDGRNMNHDERQIVDEIEWEDYLEYLGDSEN